MDKDTLEELYKTFSIDNNWQVLTASTVSNSLWFDTKLSNTIDVFDATWFEDWKLAEEWKDINHSAKNNEALQKAIERVKILYYLSKEDGHSKT